MAESDRPWWQSIGTYREQGDPAHLAAFYQSREYRELYAAGPKDRWVKKYDFLRTIIQPTGTTTLLDVGCATRDLARTLVPEGGTYASFDISARFEPDFVGDAHDLAEIVPGPYDWILLLDILEHVHDPVRVLSQAAQIGRHLLLMLPQWYHLECLPIPRSWRNRHDRHIHVGGARFWRERVAEAGLEVEREYGFFFVPSLAFNIGLNWLVRLDDWFERSRVFRALDTRLFSPRAGAPFVRRMGQEAIFVCRPRRT